MALTSTPTRYGGVAIALHWVSALAIVILFGAGLAAEQADPAAKLTLVRLHAALGVTVLLLTVLRIVWWWLVDRPPAPVGGTPAWQNAAARAVHAGLYLTVLLLAASGIGTLVLSGALPALLAGMLLPDFEQVPATAVHSVASRLLLSLFALHVAAALWHQFIRRDRLLARMGIGK